MTPLKNRASASVRKEQAPFPAAVFRSIRREMEDVERNLHAWSDSPIPLISEVNRYIFQEKGKRLRPGLLLLSARLSGYGGPEDSALAAMIEIIHTASLIHDDIIDNASMRRGRISIHAKWGPNISVLLGDHLFIKSLGLSLRLSESRIIPILVDVSGQMIEGELTEYSFRGNPAVTEDQYLDIAGKKTASLFAAACRIGAVLGRVPAEEEVRLTEIGHNLGLSFQIIDDLLDIVGDPEILGKPILSDLTEGRFTLPLIHALRGGSEDGSLAALLRSKNLDKKAKQEVIAALKKSGSLDYACGQAECFSARARDLLSRYAESPYREAMNELSRYILDRKK